MDIKEKIEELVKKITSDEQLLASFKKDPIKAVEKLIGIDLPDDQIKSIVDGIKAKIAIDDIDDIGDVIDNLGDKLGSLGGLFGKK
ncbi:MAG: hypothetical protein IJC98_01215 [Clostridia bacterium]|nr:hypothetical protein [Clostridia bacterium]